MAQHFSMVCGGHRNSMTEEMGKDVGFLVCVLCVLSGSRTRSLKALMLHFLPFAKKIIHLANEKQHFCIWGYFEAEIT